METKHKTETVRAKARRSSPTGSEKGGDMLRGTSAAVQAFNAKYSDEQLEVITANLRKWYAGLHQEVKLAVALATELKCHEFELPGGGIGAETEARLCDDLSDWTSDDPQVETFRQFYLDLRRAGL